LLLLDRHLDGGCTLSFAKDSDDEQRLKKAADVLAKSSTSLTTSLKISSTRMSV